MAQILTQATSPGAMSKTLELPAENYSIQPFIRVGDEASILLNDPDYYGMVSGKWGLKLPEVDRQLITHVPIHRVLARPKLNILFRKQRAIIPANCFCVQSGNDVYLIRLLKERVVGLAGVWKSSKAFGQEQYQFALMTTDAPDILRSISDQIPIITPLDKRDKWLSDKPLDSLMNTADRSSNQWFDFFKVSPLVLDIGVSDVNLLKPLGMSYQEIKNREFRLKELKIKSDRANRSGK